MSILLMFGVVALAYVVGSIPFGLILVKLTTGKDIRGIESGRTGGTNAMRAGGFWLGFLTAILDITKAASVVWLARWVGNGEAGWIWIEVLAPLLAIVGHNYSIFLPIRNEAGKIVRLHGGAGGASAFGGAIGLWAPSVFIIFPLALLIFFGVGYASVTTMSVAFLAILIFSVRFLADASPWQYILYGVVAQVLLIWALRPNIKRLLNGTERLHGWRAKHRNGTAAKTNQA